MLQGDHARGRRSPAMKSVVKIETTSALEAHAVRWVVLVRQTIHEANASRIRRVKCSSLLLLRRGTLMIGQKGGPEHTRAR